MQLPMASKAPPSPQSIGIGLEAAGADGSGFFIVTSDSLLGGLVSLRIFRVFIVEYI